MTEFDVKPDLLLVMAEAARAEACQATLKANNLVSRVAWTATAREGRDFLFCEGAYAGRNPADRPRVVFLELDKEIDDNLKFICDVKANDQLKRVPIVVISTLTDDRYIFECYRCGGNSYVRAPDTPEQFGDLIAQIGRYWLVVNRSPN